MSNKNYIMLDGRKIELSGETAENLSKQFIESKVTQLKPYFEKIKSDCFSEAGVEDWEGHFGLTENGCIVLCSPSGRRIESGTLLRVTKLTFTRVLYINPRLELPFDSDRKLIIK